VHKLKACFDQNLTVGLRKKLNERNTII